jgi:type III pantothenate kinase
MLLVLDVGNTNTVLGVFAKSLSTTGAPLRYDKLLANWRVTTRAAQTIDEYGVLFRNLFSMQGLEPKDIGGIVISSVVPPLDSTLRRVCERYFERKPLFIEPGVKTGMPVLASQPACVATFPTRVENGIIFVDLSVSPTQ